MRSVTVRTADLKNIIINLGFVGENEHRQIRFDAKKDFEEYPHASASLTVVPPEGESYPAIIERDGDYVLWTITDSDVIGEGDGEIQLAFTEGEVVKRTCIGRTKTDRSLVPTGSIPSGIDDFITRAGTLLEQVEETFPAGGTTGQVLAKKSDADYDTEWVDQGGGGGTSDYEELDNLPQIGGVTLKGNKTLHDLGAAAESDIPDVSGFYTKPADGIPASDMASGVIPVLTDLIDDTAGEGDTNKVWSADKSSSLLTEITKRPEIKDVTVEGVDLDVTDSSGNVIARFKDGHIQTKKFNSANNGSICYVATTGSDSASGDSSHPFATIQHAIDNGYNRIMVAPGEYKNQKVNIRGKHGLSIICNTNQSESNLFESHNRQARAKLDNSIDVTGWEAYNSIFRTALEVDEDSSYYKVFVSKTVDPVYSGSDYYGRVTTYNAILWEITDSILTCERLVPKLTVADCEANAGSFTYDGTYLYVHPTEGSLTGVSYKRLNDDTFTSITKGFYVYNSTDIYIEGLDIQFFPYYDFHANLVSGLVMRDCGFFFTCYGSAAEYQNCNGDMWECNAAKAGADGFGIASGGNASFFNCNAVYCYDDGISHHDGATGIIDGGIWTYCKKGGVTPSYGSHVTVKNVIATNNVYGIYWTQNSTRKTDGKQYMQNCLAVDNTTKDIKITGYDVVSHNCSYEVKEVDTGATLTEYNSTVIS